LAQEPEDGRLKRKRRQEREAKITQTGKRKGLSYIPLINRQCFLTIVETRRPYPEGTQ
jgi:hypothetical protein